MSNGLYPRRPHSRPSVRAWSLLAALLLGPLAPPVAVAQTQPVVLPKVPYVEAALVNGRVRVAYDTQGTSISVAPSMVRDLRASYDAAVVSVTDADLQMALPPISEAGDPQTVVEGTTVTLNGNRSVGIGPPSEPLIYVWTQTGGAPRVDLENADTAHPTFTAPDGLAPDTMLELTFKLRIITEIVAAFDTVVITVVNAVAVAAPGDQTYTLDTVIKDLTLPEATGGIGTATYTLMPLPDGLTFDVDSRVLSGTPTTEETVTAIYTATDERGASQLDTFIITISPDMLLEFATTRFALPEHSDPPQVMLSATNANGNAVTLALLDGLDADLFTLEDSLSIGGTTTANLRFKVSPDFENPRDVDISGGFDAAGNNSYRVQVRASSMSLRGDMLQITENITVIVTNIDEYDPVLNTTQTTYNVPENSTGAFVTLQASDAGGDTLRFVIVDDTATSPDRASFTLNPSTGALAFASPPDFEAPDDVGNDRTYQITVQATSTSTSGSGSGSGSSTPPRASNPLTLTINVTPVDEYDPIITPDQSIYAFPEGATGPIATFTIVDDDAGEVREFRPLGAAPGSSADLADFDFNQDTGALSFQGGAPIRSAVNALRIRATSNGKEAPQRLISVILNSPAEFTPTSFIIPENSAPVFILTRPSFGGNSYNSHISGFDNALLASSGAGISGGVFRYTLDFFDPPDFENPRDVDIIGGLDIGGNNIYVVRVDRTQTSDGAVTSSYISITVTNLDDNDPVLTTTRSTYNVPENSTATIVRLAASDADGDTLSFEIIEAAARSPDKDQFSLNPSTGDLAFKTPKDFEAPDDAGANGVYQITVQATSGDPKKFSNPLALEIRLIDGNEAPTLSTTRTTYDVFENSMDTIATLEGDDADQDPLSFEIVSGAGSPDKDRFSLNPSTGDLAFVSPQDFESPGDANVDGIYHITVRATSTSTSGSGIGRSPQASSPLALTITLIAIDEDDPTIAPSQEDYFIQAGVTEIATFIIVDSDRGETRTFDALEAAPGGSVTDLSAFNFDTDSGVLSFTGRSSNNVSKLVIRANSDAKAAMHAITVNRDSPPAFVVTAFDLPENSNPPQVMLSVTDANDETVTLTLEDDELDGTLFTLEDIASVGGTTTANLRFIAQPDFENPADAATSGGDAAGNNIYLVRVHASSSDSAGNPTLLAERISITVTDVDEDPTLAVSLGPYNLAENSTDVIATLTGADLDDGDVVRLSTSGTDAALFSLDGATGELTFTNAPDFERPRGAPLAADNTNTYNLSVQAVSGTPPNERESAVLDLVITVTPVDDNEPVLDPTQAIYDAPENSIETIVTLTATDADGDIPSFNILNNPALSPDHDDFILDPSSGDLRFASAQDFEAHQDARGGRLFAIRVEVTSGSINRDRAPRLLLIRLTDVDDNAPVLTTTQSIYDVPENTMDTIVRLEASDTEGNPLSFEIASGADSPDEDRFTLGASTGILTFANPQDFEAPNDVGTDGTYNITVQATSTPTPGSGSPPRTSSPLALAIRLTAVDEADPTITPAQATYSFSTGATGLIATFTIVDSDAGEMRAFDMLEMASNTTNLTDFSFNTSSGALSFQGPATAGTSALTITATSDTRTAMRAITITVTDDNPAVFADTEFELPEDNDPPQVMLSATDADGATVTLTLMNVRDGALFSLEDSASVGGTTTANLRFMDQPDFENPADTATSGGDAAGDNIYLVEVQASSMDLNGVAVPVTETIRITVTDVDEHAPTLTITSGPYNLAENSTAVIATLTGVDLDDDDMVRLSASGADEALFSIDAAGALTFAAAPDFERPRGAPLSGANTNTYNLSVQATSTSGSGTPPNERESAALDLTIRVTPVDEEAPVLAPRDSPLTSVEGETAPLQTFTLTDADAGEVQAFALSGAGASSFELGTTSGVLTLPAATGAGSYDLTVTGTSGDRADAFPLTVNIAADAAPAFVETNFTVIEGTNDPIILTATEANNDDVVFALQGGPDAGRFTFADGGAGDNTATLTFNTAPDFEAPEDTGGNNIYEVSVQASSITGGRAARTTTETIRITVTGVDDNAPALDPTQAIYEAPENSTETIITLQATDADGDTPNFEIVDNTATSPDRARFDLNELSGVLAFATPQDFEAPNDVGTDGTYNITVQATSGIPPRPSNPLALTIRLTPVDEEAPVLAPKTSPLTTTEGETAPLQTFTLTDADAGEAQFFALSGAGVSSFELDTATGALRLPVTTDAGSYSLTVTGTSGSRADAFTFTVDVMSDNPAVFADTAFELPENSNPPQVMLSVTDADGATVTLALMNVRDGALFSLEDSASVGGTTTANLRFVDPPDFENPADTATSGSDTGGDNIYLVEVQASSTTGARAARTITETITIRITGVDDNDPVLTTTRATYNAPENSTETIVTLQATDADGDTPNFEIVDNTATSPDRARFDLNELSGVLAFATPQDFEAPNDVGTDGIYNITVQATSTSGSGTGSRTSNTLALAITLTAIDEADPTIAPAQATYNFLTGTTGTIATFTIVDSDQGETRTFSTLEAAPGTTNLTDFNFDPSSGVLSFQGAATAGTSALTITATSGTRMAMRTVTITVASDNPAVFADTAFELPEDNDPPQVMLSATDADGATVTLTLMNVRDGALFSLEDGASVGGTTTANLRFVDPPDFENPADTATSGGDAAGDNIYLVEVQASSMDLNGVAVPITETIRITVTGVDEHLPTLTITPGPYSLAENSTAVIATLTGADSDDGDVVHLIKTGADEARFNLDPGTGILTFTNAPDFERPRGMPLSGANTNTYNLSVQATSTSTSNERESAVLDLTIMVTPVDEDTPRIVASPDFVTYNFLTGTTGPIITFTLEDTDAGAADAGAGTGGETRQFEVLGGADATSGLFSLAPTDTASETANLTFASAATTGTRALTIMATSGNQTATLPITVVVSNDQMPSLQTANFDVAENSTPDLELSAPDPDGSDIDVTLSLLSGLDGALFALNNIVPLSASAALRFIDPPDFEMPKDVATTTPPDPANNNIYLVNIQASSLNLAGETVNITQTIRVTVLGVDDNEPVLDPTQAIYDAPENSIETIVTLQATDADGDIPSFEILNNPALSPDHDDFILDPSSGDLRFASAQDFEAHQDTRGGRLFAIRVEVTSGSVNRDRAPRLLLIRLTDVDDNDPVLTTTRATYDVPENTMDTIVRLEATDAEGNPLSFEIASGADSPDEDRFTLGASTGILTFANPQDFEASNDVGTDGTYNITVQATSGIPPRPSNPLALTIRLTPVDEFTPVLAPRDSPLTSVEGETAPLQTFTLTDADAGEAQSFALSGADVSSFELNPTSGALRLPVTTGAGSYDLTVTGTSGSRADAFTFTVDVMSDNPAVFADTAFELPEDRNPPQVMLSATDADGATVTLTLMNVRDGALFTLEDISSVGGTTTANLRFIDPPDFENPADTATSGSDTGGDNIYLVEVQASSTTGARAARTTTETITITVTGVDEHLPTFAVSPGPYNLAENSTAVIATLTGADQDDGDMVSLSTAGTDAALFSIDGAGALTFTNAPDFERPRGAPLSGANTNTYNLSVQAVSGTPPNERRSITSMLNITVTPVDEEAPVLAPRDSPLTSVEGETAPLQTFALTDADAGEAQAFALSGAGASSFELGTTSGVLTLPATTGAGNYSLTVTGTSGSRTDAFTFTVNVAADAAPAFVDTSFSVAEGTNDPITLTATEANNDDVTFTLQGGPNAGRFTFADGGAAANTATLTFNAVPDFEVPLDDGGNNIYEVSVQASSTTGARAARTITETITITVTPVDDNDPVLTTTRATYNAPENSTETIITLQATDADGDTPNFEIVDNTATSPDRARFDLNELSGVLAFATPQDFEAPNDVGTDGIYNITVQATSTSTSTSTSGSGTGSRTSNTLALAVTLTAIDEADPTIAPAQATYNFLTGTTGTIATFTIVDSDQGETRTFSTLEAAPGTTNLTDFNFDPSSGVLSFQGAAANGTSALIISATSGTRMAMRTITITVMSDNPAVFADTAFELPEDRNPPQVMLSATDADGATVTLTLEDDELDGALFSLEDGASVGGTTTANLRFNDPPDFENPADTATSGSDTAGNNIYLVEVRASSMDLNGVAVPITETIRITVTGVDDNAPVLDPTQAIYEAPENSTEPIVTLQATDADGDIPSFEIVDNAAISPDRNHFILDRSSGVLRFASPQDFEAHQDVERGRLFGIRVKAISGPADIDSAPRLLLIRLTPVDEFAPVLAPKTSPLTTTEGETAPLQTFTLTDADAGEAQSFALSGTDASSFDLNTTTGVLRLPMDTDAGSYSLTVTGTSGSQTDTFTFTVDVMSDNPAVFADTAFELPEDRNPPQVMLSATDADGATVTLELTNARDSTLFTLEDISSTGGTTTANLRFIDPPDFENPADTATSGGDAAGNNIYLVRVRASSMDLNGVAVPITETIRITVTGVDEHLPTLAVSPGPYNLAENSIDVIATLTAADQDDGDMVRLSTAGTDAALFSIDAAGALTFAAAPDFERPRGMPLSGTNTNTYNLSVQAVSGTPPNERESAVLDLVIIVTPVDEDTPVLAPRDSPLTSVEGETAPLQTFTLTDADAGEAQSFALSGANANLFALDTTTGVLTLPTTTDAGNYNLIVTGTSGSRADSFAFTVDVMSDNPAVFADTAFELPEDRNPPQVMLSATDADGATVTLTLTNARDNTLFTLEDISSTGGTTTANLRFIAQPDFENPADTATSGGDAAGNNIYLVRVRASSMDLNGVAVPITEIIRITVTGVDEHLPTLAVSPGPYNLAENSTDVIATLTAADQDDGDVVRLSTAGTDAALFSIDAAGALTFTAAPDFERPRGMLLSGANTNTYNLSVQAVSGTPPNERRSITSILNINITPVDEDAPVLAPRDSPLTSVEGEAAPLQTFTLTDADAGEAQSFALSGAGASSFELGTTSGVLRLPATTGAGSYDLTVTGTSGSQTDTFTFTVDVTGDNPAVFADTAFELPEDRNPPQVVLSATDDDGVTVTLALGNGQDSALFTLEDSLSTGGTTMANLRFRAQPDFENPADTATPAADNIYLVEAQASSTDLNGTVVRTNETITIRITGVDEHLPTLAVTPGPYNLAENSTALIATLTAADQDDGDVVRLSTAGTDAALFSIDAAGALTFTAAPDFERPRGAPLSGANTNTYNLSVQAISGIDPNERRSITSILNINITPVDEEAPVLAPKTSPLMRVEGEMDALQTFTLTDADAGEAQTFALSGTGASSFALDTTTGALRLPAATGAGSYDLIVTGTSGSRADAFPFTVNIATDAAPAFAETSFSVVEGTNDPITLTATEANNDDVVFTLQSGLDAGRFTFADGGAGANTATLTFQDAPDFENPLDAGGNNVYEVSVQASSMGGARAARTITETIRITVTGVDDNDPILTTTQATFEVPENTTETIVTLQGADVEGDTLRFEIVDNTGISPDRARFTLDASTGVLAFASPKDFEAPSDANTDHTYQITVRATSTSTSDSGSGTPPRTSTPLALAIRLTAIDEADPSIAPAQATYSFRTGTTGTIAAFTIEDDDAGETHVFEALEAAPGSTTDLADFRFDTNSGALSFARPAATAVSALIIRATSNGKPAMRTITLTVDDMDAPPEFVETTFSQAENAMPTFTLAATEADGDDVSFTLQSGRDAAYFTLTDGGVSADTAALVFRDAPNFENPQSATLPGDAGVKNTYQMNVQAASTTSPNAEQTITQIITINVTDVDDPPTFTTAADALMIMEGETALTTMIEVIDQDGDPVTLALTGGTDQARLRLTGGALSFTSAPDFEAPTDTDTNNIYEVEITAISTGSGTGAIVLSAVRTFNITVTDADDNAPELTSPTTFQIQSGETAVAILEATDADAGDTETIVFALTGGADQSQFTLTRAGVLSFTSAADFAEPTDADGDNIYAIEITLTSGSRPHTTQAALEIEVISIDRQSRQRIGNVILAHIARSLADNTQEIIFARTSGRLTNNLALSNRQGDLDDLVDGIQGFSFMRKFDAKQTQARGFSLWGKGHIRTFSASPSETAINNFSGHIYNLNLGADYQTGALLFGGLVTASQSSVKFTSGSTEGQGRIRTKLTTFAPYVHLRFQSGTEIWGSAGFGQGRMRYQSETTGGFERTDLKYAQFAGGLYQPLKALQKTNLALRLDGYTARLKAEAREDIFLAMAGDVSRVRALLEVGYRRQGAEKGVFDAKLNGGARLERGDIGKGVGLEFGAEITYANPASGFSLSADINTILLHTAQKYRHLDAGLRFLLGPGIKKRGLQFRLEPRIGGTTSAAPLWDGTLVDGGDSPAGQLGTSGLGQLQTALGLSYGFAARQSLLTPFTEMRLDDRGAPIDLMLGMRFSRANLPINITLYTQKVLGATPGATPGVHLKLNWR